VPLVRHLQVIISHYKTSPIFSPILPYPGLELVLGSIDRRLLPYLPPHAGRLWFNRSRKLSSDERRRIEPPSPMHHDRRQTSFWGFGRPTLRRSWQPRPWEMWQGGARDDHHSDGALCGQDGRFREGSRRGRVLRFRRGSMHAGCPVGSHPGMADLKRPLTRRLQLLKGP
jgi:hypothetical protein